MDRKYVYTSYDYYRSQKFLEKYSEKERNIIFKRRKKTEPIEYFVDYIRYNNVFTLTFDKQSEYGNTLSILEPEKSHIFFNTEVEQNKSIYNIRTSFSDLVKLFIIDDLRTHHPFSEEALRRIAILLRYSEHQTLEPPEAIDKDINMYLFHSFTYNLFLKKEFNLQDRKEHIAKLNKKIKKNSAYIVHKMLQKDTFEKVLYYILNTQKTVFIFIPLDKDNLYSIGNLSYIHTLDNVYSHHGVYINLLPIAGIIQMKNNQKQTLMDKLRKDLMRHEKQGEKTLATKWKYIQSLERKKKRAGSREDRKEYEKLSKEIQRCHLEIDIDVKPTENAKKHTKKKQGVSNSSIDVKFFEQAIPHINKISHGEVTISIDKKKLKEFSVYSKHNAKDIDDIKKENPFAEVGGVQYEGKRQYTTLRYKKKVA